MTDSLLSDSALRPAVESLYRTHHGWLKAWLRGKLGCSEQAADVAHDTYVRLIVAGSRPQADQSRRYLAQIANGLVIDLFRRRRIEAAYLQTVSQLPEAQAPSPETGALVIDALVQIDTQLSKLPVKARQAFLLCKLDGMGYRDIAQRLGVSTSSVEKYVARALQACYAALDGEEP